MAVGTVKKSIEASWETWLERKVRHYCERGSPLATHLLCDGGPDPEQAVHWSEAQALRTRPLEYLQLVTQHQHLELEGGS